MNFFLFFSICLISMYVNASKEDKKRIENIKQELYSPFLECNKSYRLNYAEIVQLCKQVPIDEYKCIGLENFIKEKTVNDRKLIISMLLGTSIILIIYVNQFIKSHNARKKKWKNYVIKNLRKY